MQTKVKSAVAIITAAVILFAGTILIYNNIVSTVQANTEVTIEEFKETQFNSIWMYLELLSQQANEEVTLISKNIENDLLSLSDEELKLIEADMNNDIHNSTLHNIIMENTESRNFKNISNSRNGIIIMSTDGYMEDFNYRRADKCDNTDNPFRTWEDSINHSYNKDLEEDAIDKILNRTSGIIALESYDLTGDEDHIKIKELTYKSLLKVYSEEGLEGLRNYQILVPYYITDIGDIFGVPDISQGILVDNNKIIVVQEFNLYDQIIATGSSIFDDSQIQDYINSSESLLNLLRLFGTTLVISILGIILYICNLYNNTLFDDDDDHEDEESEIETENNETENGNSEE